MERKRFSITAVRDVSFEIPMGKTLALVGSSGSGKSTVARCVTRLERPDSGQIFFSDTDIAPLGSHDLRTFRSEIQMIFQDAATSMNPRFSAGEVIEEPMLIQEVLSKNARKERVKELMRDVGLAPERVDRPATDFSGGQQQRLAIARALSVRPKLLVLDEALSGLDLSSEAQIVNLLLDLQQAYSLTYLFISHDLSLVARFADVIAVISAGQIVEQGPTAQIIANPTHPQTIELLASAKSFQTSYSEMLGVAE
ncbi:MAG: ATP-binding cassette domain-containing protein [Acidobacteriota bacterium]|nr:ATP-binding cassette domain-containing protein [Acidobacteriota bacterium]